MRIELLLISALFSISIYSQNNEDSKSKAEKIQEYSILLSGSWKLMGKFENDHVYERETKIAQIVDHGVSSEYFLKYTDSGAVLKKTIDNKVAFIKKTEFYNIKFDFNSNGDGIMTEVMFDPNIKNGELLGYSNPPVPKLVYRGGNYILEMTGISGVFEMEFEINENILVLKRTDDNIEIKYKKIHD